jgi:competence protein ComEA
MRSRSPASDHDAAVAHRLELLSSELAAVRGDASDAWVIPRRPAARPVPDLDHEAPTVEPAPAPVVVPMPGRHASRRAGVTSGDGWKEAVPASVRGRFGFGAGQVAVVAVLAVVGLVATCWYLVRSAGHEVGTPVAVETPHGALVRPSGSAGPAAPGGVVAASAPAPRSSVVVDVAGKVRRPGIAVLRSGARVVDAIRAAGGARPGVDLGALNLAQVLSDGEQVVVGTPAPLSGPVAALSGAPPTSRLVSLNTADETALESLPEVGPVTAQAIIAWRTEHGGFSAVSQLLDVDGIGDATLAKLTPYVTL